MKVSNKMRASLAACAIAMASGHALSTTINVPADQPTIQAAINAAVDGNEIVVAAGTYTEAIDLMGKSLTITGAGAASTTIDATGVNAPAITVIGGFEGLTMSGFTVVAGNGLEVPVDPADPSLGTITVGGAFYIEASELDLNGVTVRDGSVTGLGGGIRAVDSTLIVSDSEFTNNFAGEEGGAISASNSISSITNSEFANNTSDDIGGAIRVVGAAAVTTIADSTFTGNVANGAFGGGAVRFSGNGSISGTLFEANRSDERGGALFVSAGFVEIDDSIFRDNIGTRGGAIHFNVNGGALVTNTVFNNNRTAGSNRSQGTAIYALGTRSSNPDLEAAFVNCQFINHTAENGGRGIIYSTNSSSSGGGYIRIADSLFENNSSDDRGGVGYSTGSTADLSPATVIVQNTTMLNNTANGRGGAFYVDGGARLELEGSTIDGSTSGDRGGAIYLFRGSASIRDSRIANSEGSEGGAISMRSSGSGGVDLELDNVAFIDNTSEFGGAIYSQGSTNNPNTITANRVLITGNSASLDEAGAVTFLGGSLALSNSLIADNQGSLTGAIYANNADVLIVNSTIANNPADPIFGFVESLFIDADVDLTVQNSIIWNDQLTSTLPMISLGPDSNMTAEWSNIEGGEAAVELSFSSTTNWVAGNIDADPLFVNSAGGNYRLGEDSPSVDAGDSSLAIGDFDLEGNDRIINAVNYPSTGPVSPAVDHGAYEAPADLPGGTGPTCPPDLNGDGVVDADDFFLFLQLFAAGDTRADFNNDGVIDADDFFAFLAAFAAGC